MDGEEFEKAVSARAGMPRDKARVLIQATLQTLAERLTGGEADDLAAQLPKQMKEWLAMTGPAESFGLDEFIQRVSKRANVTPEEGRRIAEAVFTTLREAVTGGEFRDVMPQLPREFSAPASPNARSPNTRPEAPASTGAATKPPSRSTSSPRPGLDTPRRTLTT